MGTIINNQAIKNWSISVEKLNSESMSEVYRTASDQNIIDSTKITNPSGGTVGQVLTKTAEGGEEWKNVGGGNLRDGLWRFKCSKKY